MLCYHICSTTNTYYHLCLLACSSDFTLSCVLHLSVGVYTLRSPYFIIIVFLSAYQPEIAPACI